MLHCLPLPPQYQSKIQYLHHQYQMSPKQAQRLLMPGMNQNLILLSQKRMIKMKMDELKSHNPLRHPLLRQTSNFQGEPEGNHSGRQENKAKLPSEISCHSSEVPPFSPWVKREMLLDIGHQNVSLEKSYSGEKNEFWINFSKNWRIEGGYYLVLQSCEPSPFSKKRKRKSKKKSSKMCFILTNKQEPN